MSGRVIRSILPGLDTISLLIGTFWLRPYVFAFLAVFVVIAMVELGRRRTLTWLVVGYAIAFACEWSSTRSGFPFGLYHYLDATRGQELWVSNVPFFDSLSFVFLSYVSWATARRLLGVGAQEAASGTIVFRPGVLLLGAALMVAIDLVCDPVSLRGDRWFLGRIYYYETPGAFFGVPLTNFLGWGFVALAIMGVMAALERLGALGGRPLIPLPFSWGSLPISAWLAPGFYAAIVLFNVGIAFAVELPGVGILGLCLVATLFMALHLQASSVAREPGLEQAG